MKIVHIANFYSEKSGGIKTTINELGVRYQRLGHEFFYIVPGPKYELQFTPSGTKISMPSFRIPFSGGYRVLRSNKEIRRALSLLQPQRIEVSDRLSLRKIGLWARKRKIQTVVFSHESLEALVLRFFKFDFFRRVVAWHNRRLAASFDWVVASTEFAAREFQSINVRNLRHVPLGVDLETFHPSVWDEDLRRKLLADQEILLVHCGRLSVEKNPEQSIRVLKALNESGYRARLVFIGMGPMYRKLQKLADGHPIDFLGYIVGPQRVAKHLACADVVLAPGPHETFCLAALEALACGTPVVASQQSAVTEILLADSAEQVGQVCGDHPYEWVNAILDLIHTPDIRIAARKRAEKFPWSKTIAALSGLNEKPLHSLESSESSERAA